MGVWKWPWRATGSSGFGSSSTAEQVTEGIDATHLTAIVTGATSGIGKETARVLALRGAKVIIPSRTLESGMKVKESLLGQNPDAKIQVIEMDLSSLASIESFVRSFNSSNKHLNILINNAGILACPFQLSEDGIELQFATNHLGHFLLTNLLLEKMKATAEEIGIQGRIINVSSIAHWSSDGSWFILDKITDKSRYACCGVYCHTKLANILHANELSQKLQEQGSNVTANSLHPGIIFTNIFRYTNLNGIIKFLSTFAPFAKSIPQEQGSNVTANSLHPGIIFTNIFRYTNFNGIINFLSTFAPFVKSIPQGAATNCYVAVHPNIKNVTGKYFVDCNQITPSAKARDEALGKKLWDLSEELIKRYRRIK